MYYCHIVIQIYKTSKTMNFDLYISIKSSECQCRKSAYMNKKKQKFSSRYICTLNESLPFTFYKFKKIHHKISFTKVVLCIWALSLQSHLPYLKRNISKNDTQPSNDIHINIQFQQIRNKIFAPHARKLKKKKIK